MYAFSARGKGVSIDDRSYQETAVGTGPSLFDACRQQGRVRVLSRLVFDTDWVVVWRKRFCNWML